MWTAGLYFLLLATTFVSCEIKNKGWWEHTVFYQIYPRSFMDSDDDGIGDLKGITSRLEHFVDAGVGGVWLSPIYASPMVDFGYDISNFTMVHPTFGTMEDFDRLVARAKELGVKVILDFVPNHSSDESNWFEKSIAGEGKYADYYVWRDGKNKDDKVPPNNWISVFGGPAWTYSEARGQWYLHQFLEKQPDLNYNSPALRAEMEDVLRFWLSRGVDGFRVDAVPYFFENSDFTDEPRTYASGATEADHTYLSHIYTMDDPRTYDLVESWRKVMDEYADANNEDEKVMMTEAYTDINNTVKFYNYGVQVPFNFEFISGVDSSSSPENFKSIIDKWLTHMPKNTLPNWVMGNHDNKRIASRFPGRSDQMTMLAMILPGIAVTYYGEEIGMVDKDDITWEDTQDPQACAVGKERYKDFTRDPIRTPFQWDSTKNAGFSRANHTWVPVNQNYKELNLANQKAANESHYKIYQSLTKMRKSSTALERGRNKVQILNDNKVLAVIRESTDETVVLLINFSNDDSQVVNLDGHANLYNNTVVAIASLGSPLKAGTSVDPRQIHLPAKVAVVLSSK